MTMTMGIEEDRERQIAEAWGKECDAHKKTKEELLSTQQSLEEHKILLDREQTLCTTFAKQVTELQGKLATAKLDVEAARRERSEVIQRLVARETDVVHLSAANIELSAVQLQMQEEANAKNVCWHCHILLEIEDPPHCDACPSFNGCDDDLCNEPGCEVDLNEIREDGRLSKGLRHAAVEDHNPAKV